MANGLVSPSRLGQNNLDGGTDALFLKVFANEILTTFEEANVMKDLHTVRTIQSGKSAQFPVTGIATAKYHTVGEDILETGSGTYTSNLAHTEKVITIDDVLLAATFVSNIDEMKNHYDVRSIYAKELGKALAKRFDLATMKTLFAAAGSAASYTGGKGGSSLTADVSTSAGIISAITAIAQKLDENDVPEDERFALLTPALYYRLAGANSSAIDRDFNTANGSVAEGKVFRVAGIDIIKTNHLQDMLNLSNASAGSSSNDADSNNDVHGDGGVGYDGNFANCEFIAGHKSAIGTVKLLDLSTESEYLMTKQGTALVAKYAMGHGILRPECAVKATTTA